MPSTPNVLPGTPVSSVWGNAIRNRTIQIFDTETEMRAWSGAIVGSIAMSLDKYVLWERRTTDWVQVSPQGLLERQGSDSVAGPQTIPGGYTTHDVWTAGSINSPVNQGRTALVTVSFVAYESTAGAPAILGVDVILSTPGSTPAWSQKSNVGSVAVHDTSAILPISFSGIGVFSVPINPAITDDVDTIQVNVFNIAPNAAVIEFLVIEVTEV